MKKKIRPTEQAPAFKLPETLVGRPAKPFKLPPKLAAEHPGNKARLKFNSDTELLEALFQQARLSRRQREAAHLMARGYPRKLLAEKMTINENTAASHQAEVAALLRPHVLKVLHEVEPQLEQEVEKNPLNGTALANLWRRAHGRFDAFEQLFDHPDVSLTPRQKECVRLAIFDFSRQQIANQLNISLATAKAHCIAAVEKLKILLPENPRNTRLLSLATMAACTLEKNSR